LTLCGIKKPKSDNEREGGLVELKRKCEKRLMNFIVLKEYTEVLKALRPELVAMVKLD
jgi:SpoU rRNA methylase family enzyme